MHAYGFSTGALALGDFRRGLALLSGQAATAVELSALRDRELPDLMRSLGDLDLSQFEYVSIHAPSRFESISEARCADMLLPCIDKKWPVVVHPDAMGDPGCWGAFGASLCIENMDKRKGDGRTAEELDRWFERFSDARFCLDLAHARQVDPSMTVARQLMRKFGSRLAQVHLSELDVSCRHTPLSKGAIVVFREIAHWLRPSAVILESCVQPEGVAEELCWAREALDQSLSAAC